MKTNKGFTLIEILVVIAILSGLVAILFPNFMEVRQRARDSQRKSDMKTLQKALEMYKENTFPPAYPATGSLPGPCASWSPYMSKIPGDPSTNCTRKYYYVRTAGDNLSYVLAACLENTGDTSGETCPTDFSTVVGGYICPASHKCYIVTNP